MFSKQLRKMANTHKAKRKRDPLATRSKKEIMAEVHLLRRKIKELKSENKMLRANLAKREAGFLRNLLGFFGL